MEDVHLLLLKDAIATPTGYADDRRRIGYGETGFETFTIDVPDALRGKVATLRFELDGGNPVYLDNVFFKSQNLLLGNPGEARKPDDANNSADKYLLEKPQYAASYNNGNQHSSWVSYQIDKSWINGAREDEFNLDPTLPSQLGWYKVPGEAYKYDSTDPSSYARGHMAAALDIARVPKDAIAADLMTNMVPQNSSHNGGMWNRFEQDLRLLVQDPTHYRHLYVITGNSGTLDRITRPDLPGLNINIPASIWKIVLVSGHSIESVADVENDPTALAFAVYSPNDNSVLGIKVVPQRIVG